MICLSLLRLYLLSTFILLHWPTNFYFFCNWTNLTGFQPNASRMSLIIIASVGTALRVSNVDAQTNGIRCATVYCTPTSYTLIEDLQK